MKQFGNLMKNNLFRILLLFALFLSNMAYAQQNEIITTPAIHKLGDSQIISEFEIRPTEFLSVQDARLFNHVLRIKFSNLKSTENQLTINPNDIKLIDTAKNEYTAISASIIVSWNETEKGQISTKGLQFLGQNLIIGDDGEMRIQKNGVWFVVAKEKNIPSWTIYFSKKGESEFLITFDYNSEISMDKFIWPGLEPIKL
jgi:hypothetical protein